MPKHLLIACFLYVAARSAMAVLATFYETGISRVTSPVLMLLFVAIWVLFMRRVPWAWQALQSIAFAEIGINSVFFPIAEFFGAYTALARWLAGAIIVACGVILWSLSRRPDVNAWFNRRDRDLCTRN